MRAAFKQEFSIEDPFVCVCAFCFTYAVSRLRCIAFSEVTFVVQAM